MNGRTSSRRDALKAIASSVSGALLAGCRSEELLLPYRAERLVSRPTQPRVSGPVGRAVVEIGGSRVVMYVPAAVNAARPTALLVVLHGAFRDVDPFVDGHIPGADRHGVIIAAPYATLGTWDAIDGVFGEDIDLLDAMLAWIFERWTIDPARTVLSGFSDGATYSLGVGRANGDVFSRVVAYAPGFLLDITEVGRPQILITHGTRDGVIPYENTSRFIVPWLRQLGYPVDYREWDGPHAVPLAVVNEVLASIGNA
jgi:phospholipase/carboxylesterase